MSQLQRIAELISDPGIEVAELVYRALELVKDQGDVLIVKADGERGSKWFTVLLSRPSSGQDLIRHDSSDLKKSVLEVLQRYVADSATTL